MTAETEPRHLTRLSHRDSLRLLASAPVGRVVFTQGALPAIRPVNHLVVDDDIIIRTSLGASLVAAGARRRQLVVAYEADDIDPATRTGWSVVVTGMASQVDEPAEAARFEAALHPWVDQPMDVVIRIRPELVTGYRLDGAATPAVG